MKIGLVSLPLSGHLNPYLAVARTLRARGHEPVYFGPLDCAPACEAAGIEFVPYGEQEFPLGAVAETWKPVARIHGFAITEHAVTVIGPRLLSAALGSLPAAVRKSGVEAMIIDPVFFFIEVVPLGLKLPYVHLLSVIGFDFSGVTPPSLFPWTHEDTPEAHARNLEGVGRVVGAVTTSVPLAAAWAQENGLAIDFADPDALPSKLATISPMPKEFDFPGVPWPPTFHYTGPMVDDRGRAPVPFDWERLDGRPLIYASLGTLTNGVLFIHKAILAAAGRLRDYQLVFSIGGNIRQEEIGPIPENVLVVAAAPQIELLQRAALCITHAGINTTLECLAQGVPMVAIPVGYDQPGAAVRIAYHGVGEFITVDDLTADALFPLLERVLSEPLYRQRAEAFRELLAGIDGCSLAADVIEHAFAAAA